MIQEYCDFIAVLKSVTEIAFRCSVMVLSMSYDALKLHHFRWIFKLVNVSAICWLVVRHADPPSNNAVPRSLIIVFHLFYLFPSLIYFFWKFNVIHPLELSELCCCYLDLINYWFIHLHFLLINEQAIIKIRNNVIRKIEY